MPIELYPAAERGKKPFEVTGRFVLVTLLLFFAVVASVNFTMLTLATRTFPGIDARNGYDVSQAYNREIATARAQAERGWKADVELIRIGAETRLVLRVRDANGGAVADLDVEGRLRHPSDRRQDHALTLIQLAPGVYEAKEQGALSGAWDVIVSARSKGEKVFASQSRIVLKG